MQLTCHSKPRRKLNIPIPQSSNEEENLLVQITKRTFSGGDIRDPFCRSNKFPNYIYFLCLKINPYLPTDYKACVSCKAVLGPRLRPMHGRVFFCENLGFRLVVKAAGKIESFSLSSSTPSSASVLGVRRVRTRTRIYDRVSACYRFRSTLSLRNVYVYLCVPLLCAVFTLSRLVQPPFRPSPTNLCTGERERERGEKKRGEFLGT